MRREKMICLECRKRILLKDAAIDYPENQFHHRCFERLQEHIAVVADRIERKHGVIISELAVQEIAIEK
jgi:hypothetical protein